MSAIPSATPIARATTDGIARWTALAVALGFALRLARPEVHSFWIDEGMTVAIAEAADPWSLLRQDSHPPLAFLLFRAWMGAFGASDLALRLLPAIAACASLALFAPLARAWLGRGERSAWAVALYAVSPLLVWYAHEVRMYAFVELAALLVLFAARRAWARPSVARWIALALAIALATGFHYYGALAGVAVVAQSARAGARAFAWTSAAGALGVGAWLPWLAEYLPRQRAGEWPVIVQTSARDLAELPARLVAVDLAVLREHGVAAVAWALAALCAAGVLVGLARAFVAREPGLRDAALALVAPVLVGLLLAIAAGGGFQPRYLTPAIPGAIATIAGGLVSASERRRARIGGRALCAVLVACAATTTALQLAQNRREDYRAAAAEIRERWRPGDRLLLLVCVPDVQVSATIDHYLRDRPDVLASRLDARRYLDGVDRPPPGTRVHVVWREATVCWEPFDRLERTHAILERAPPRFRIHRLLVAVP